jgi:hypothetical protein
MRLARVVAALSIVIASCSPSDAYPDSGPAWDAGVDVQEDPMWQKRSVQIAVLAAMAASAVVGRQAFYDNEPPVMGALSPVSGAANTPIAITGSCTDDGKPTPPTITYQWAKTAGPGSCSFGSSTTASTTATCTTEGAVTLSLTCCDRAPAAACTGLTDSDTLIATIAAYTPPVNAIVSAGGAINATFSTSHRLNTSYVGGPYTMWRVANDATQEAAFLPNGLLDEAALATFGGASDVLISTIRDQDGTPCDLTQVTESAMPKIYDGATGRVIKNGLVPVAYFDGGDRWSTTSSCGITGASAVTLSHFTTSDTTASIFRNVIGVGGTTAGQGFESAFVRNGQVYLEKTSYKHRHCAWISAGAYRCFDSPRDSRLEHYVTAFLEAGQQIGSSTSTYDGATHVQVDVQGASTTLNAVSTRTVIGQSMAFTQQFIGYFGFGLIAGQHYSGAVKAALDTWGDYLKRQARLGRRTLIMSGQSNIDFCNTNSLVFVERLNHARIARGGAPISEWATGQAKFNELVLEVQLADPAYPIVIAWGQGEHEAQVPAWAPLYAGWLQDLVTRVDVATGRAPYWIFYTLHSQADYGTAPDRALINAAYATVAAARPGNSVVVNVDAHGDLIVGEVPRAHWSNAMEAAVLPYTVGLVNALPRRPTPPKRDRNRAPGNPVSLASRRRQREERELVQQLAA